jgi:hypothetical protein
MEESICAGAARFELHWGALSLRAQKISMRLVFAVNEVSSGTRFIQPAPESLSFSTNLLDVLLVS